MHVCMHLSVCLCIYDNPVPYLFSLWSDKQCPKYCIHTIPSNLHNSYVSVIHLHIIDEETEVDALLWVDQSLSGVDCWQVWGGLEKEFVKHRELGNICLCSPNRWCSGSRDAKSLSFWAKTALGVGSGERRALTCRPGFWVCLWCDSDLLSDFQQISCPWFPQWKNEQMMGLEYLRSF